MARFKPVIRTTHKLGGGKCNIKIRITHDRKVRYLKTDYYVHEDFFDDAAGRVLPGGEVDERLAERMNNRLLMKMGAYATKLENHHDEMDYLTMQTVLKILREEREHYDFFALLDDHIAKLDGEGKESYRDSFRDTRQKVLKYERDFILRFEAITVEWLKGFEHQMLNIGNKINTVGHHMRNVRIIYNLAIRRGLTDYGKYPFREYRIPKQRT